MKHTLLVIVAICALLLVGCSASEPVKEPDALDLFFSSLTTPESCLSYSEQDAFNATRLGDFIDHAENESIMILRDACLIHLIDKNVTDESIIYCDNATEFVYNFREDANHTYQVTGKEFCYRNAFDELRFTPSPPSEGNIVNKTTCDELSSGKDNCLWVVAMNGDTSACKRMSAFENMQFCRRTFELPQIIAEAEALEKAKENASVDSADPSDSSE